jgi:hypothetical protein
MAFDLPDLSGLDNALTANQALEILFRGKTYPSVEADGLVTAFVRTTESAVDAYERARKLLVDSAQKSNGLGTYLKGLSEIEVCVTALDRAMRVAKRLVDPAEPTVQDGDLPSKGSMTRLSRMRNAIDHVDAPVSKGKFGEGRYLFLFVTETDLVINDEGAEIRVKQVDFGGWLEQLHGLADDLIRKPETWAADS